MIVNALKTDFIEGGGHSTSNPSSRLDRAQRIYMKAESTRSLLLKMSAPTVSDRVAFS
jgi:hypothetical protein